MSLIAFLYALFFQLNGTELQGNAWGKAALELTLKNLYAMESVLGWITLACVLIGLGAIVIALLTGNSWKAAFASGCTGSILELVAIVPAVIWLVGWVHILVVNFLNNNFTAAQGATNPGFWILLIIVALASWS